MTSFFFLYKLSLLAGKFGKICTAFPPTTILQTNSTRFPLNIFWLNPPKENTLCLQLKHFKLIQRSPIFLIASLMKNWIHEQILHPEFNKNLDFRGLCCKMKEKKLCSNWTIFAKLNVLRSVDMHAILSALYKLCSSKS